MGRWGRPSPIFNPFTRKYEHDGMIWHGRNPPTGADYEKLEKKYGTGVKVDKRTLVGKADPEWTTYARENRENFKTRIKL